MHETKYSICRKSCQKAAESIPIFKIGIDSAVFIRYNKIAVYIFVYK